MTKLEQMAIAHVRRRVAHSMRKLSDEFMRRQPEFEDYIEGFRAAREMAARKFDKPGFELIAKNLREMGNEPAEDDGGVSQEVRKS